MSARPSSFPPRPRRKAGGRAPGDSAPDRANAGARSPAAGPGGRARRLAVWLAAPLLFTAAFALDEIELANGRRYLGEIVADSPRSLILAIDGGTVEFPRSIVVSPPYHGPALPAPGPEGSDPAAAQIQAVPTPHALPGVTFSLRRLKGFPWGEEVRQVPVLVTDRGRWQTLPCVSFWAGGFFQVSFFGDPIRPAAVELSLPRPSADAWEQKRQLLEYMFDIAPALVVDGRFDRLNLEGDSFAVGDLWFSLSSPTSESTPGRWVLSLVHDPTLSTARASHAELAAISEALPEAMLDPAKPRSWQRGSWTPSELAWLRDPAAAPPEPATPGNAPAASFLAGSDRVFVRSFLREDGRYVRAETDWLRDLATTGP